MKIFNGVQNEVSSDGLVNKKEVGIKNASALVGTLVDSLYQDPFLATPREIIQNGLDAMKKAGRGHMPLYIHFPTALEPWFSVSDTGIGLSKQDLDDYQGNAGSTSKSGDNDSHGGFGVGFLAPFTIADQYTVTSRFDGWEYTTASYKDELGVSSIVDLGDPKQTAMPNGLEVRVPIESQNFERIKDKTIQVCKYVTPKPETNHTVEWGEVEYTTEGVGWGIRVKPESRYGGYNHDSKSRVLMGQLWYPIDSSKISDDRYGNVTRILDQGVDIFCDIGDVQLPISREAVMYTPTTIAFITAKCEAIADEFVALVQVDIDASQNVYDAMGVYIASSRLVQQLGGDTLKYKSHELSKVVQLDTPCPQTARIQRYDLSKKTLNFQGSADTHEGHTLHHQYKLHRPSNSDTVIPIMYCDTDKKIPSRLLSYMQTHHGGAAAYMFKFKEGEEAKVRRWLYTTFGWKSEIKLFSADVPDIKIVRAAASKKMTGVKHLYDDRYWSYQAQDVDLDTETGIYVDLRQNDVHGSAYCDDTNTLQRTLRTLKQYDLVPNDTQVYGCPGSHKNKMKDHKNWMSIDEAIDLAFSVTNKLLDTTTHSRLRYFYSLDVFKRTNRSVLALDISVKGSYYDIIKRHHTETRVKDKKLNSYYLGCRNLAYYSHSVGMKYNDYLGDCEDMITKKFFNRYPMFEHVTYYEEQNTKTFETYIQLTENTNV